MSEFWQDIRMGARSLSKSPAFSIVALLTIAIGIGANVAIFSFIDGVLLKPLPYPESGRIVRLSEMSPQIPWSGISTLNFLDWRKYNKVFTYLAAITDSPATLSDGDQPEFLPGQRVSVRFFEIFGLSAPVHKFGDVFQAARRPWTVSLSNNISRFLRVNFHSKG
jgi:putative ABC transport system permease protein